MKEGCLAWAGTLRDTASLQSSTEEAGELTLQPLSPAPSHLLRTRLPIGWNCLGAVVAQDSDSLRQPSLPGNKARRGVGVTVERQTRTSRTVGSVSDQTGE